MQTLKVMERVGLENTGVVNINERTSNLYVSRETAKGLTLIDQGKRGFDVSRILLSF